MILEICVYNIPAFQFAIDAGAQRIEWCASPAEGGITQSNGLLQWAASRRSVPVFPIIRPRGGYFFYSDSEKWAMMQDIELCRSLGYPGIVVGALDRNGMPDMAFMQHIMEIAYPMEVTFHRAFDSCVEPFLALEMLITLNCKRLLTSGQAKDAISGKNQLQALHSAAKGKIEIIAGGGIRSSNIYELLQATLLETFHSSAISGANNCSYAMPDAEEISGMLLQMAKR